MSYTTDHQLAAQKKTFGLLAVLVQVSSLDFPEVFNTNLPEKAQ